MVLQVYISALLHFSFMLSSELIYHQHIWFQRQPPSSVYNTHCPVSADYKWAVDNCRGFSNSGQGEQRRGLVWCRHAAWFMSLFVPVWVFFYGALNLSVPQPGNMKPTCQRIIMAGEMVKLDESKGNWLWNSLICLGQSHYLLYLLSGFWVLQN